MCKAVTECKAGAQEKTAQTTKKDRTCEPCKVGTFPFIVQWGESFGFTCLTADVPGRCSEPTGVVSL